MDIVKVDHMLTKSKLVPLVDNASESDKKEYETAIST